MEKKKENQYLILSVTSTGEFVFGPLCPDKFYEIQIWANEVKHVKVCEECKHEEKCLKGTKLEPCDFKPIKPCEE